MYIQRSNTVVEKGHVVHEGPTNKWREYRYSYKPYGNPICCLSLIRFPFKLTKTEVLVEEVPSNHYTHDLAGNQPKVVIVWLDTDEMEKLYEYTVDFINYVLEKRHSSIGATSNMLEWKQNRQQSSDNTKSDNSDGGK